MPVTSRRQPASPAPGIDVAADAARVLVRPGMSIRKLAVWATLAVALTAASHPSAQQPQTAAPTFRSRVDVITVDVVAVDKQGKPVEDLKPGDFAVKVDGRGRPVVSAQLVKIDRSTAAPAPSERFMSTNVGLEGGRRVVIAVDQTLIAPGSIAPLLRTASRFLDGLPSSDYAALVAFPEPGARVDFTTDRVRVRQAMQAIVGQPAKVRTTTFNLSLVEAQAIDGSEKSFVNILAGSVDDIWNSIGPMMRRVLERGCRSLTVDELKTAAHAEDLQQCLRDLIREAGDLALDTRTDSRVSLQRLEAYLKELAAVDGPKSLILISAGLVAEDVALEEVWRLAADARTAISVVAVDRERERDRTDLANGQSELKLQDRSLETKTLEAIAERTGGGIYRAIGPAEGVFERLRTELSASYLVAVERRDGDPERQRIDIDVKRRGVTVRSARTVTTTAAVHHSADEALRDALVSPLPVAGVPLRLSTFARRDPSSAGYRVNLAAQVDRPDAASDEYAIGYAVTDHENRLVRSNVDRVRLTATGRPGEPPQYDTALTLPPGSYLVRLAVIGADGNRGVVFRGLELPTLSPATLTTSDLIVGNTTSEVDVETLHPSVEPHVSGAVVAYLEMYAGDEDLTRLSVTLEIAEGEGSPALTSAALHLASGTQAGVRIASGAVEPTLLPGRYMARAMVRRDGVQVRTVARPFVLEKRAANAEPTPSIVRAGPAPLAADARVKTAAYVSSFVQSLANVVGQEDFELSGPERHVTSDFLLVQHPASPGDFLTYRDVTTVNGVPVPDRQERLADLFLAPAGPARDRIRRITQAAEQQVPSLLNPIFVLAFLQADLQSRFELTESDAGREWPDGVKSVAFTEVARPTILRGGLQGERDVPVRGTAWIEPGTGRVLQTELIVPNGRSSTTILTRFVLDPRLQIMVPERMRTENPKGVATYSNFRRFTVETETSVDTGPGGK